MAGGSYSSLTPPASGQVITRQWGLDVRDSVVTVHASATARDATITAPTQGQYAHLNDTDSPTFRSASGWKPIRSAPNRLRCILAQNSGTNISPGGGFQVIAFQVETWDPSGWHSTVSNTGRITPTTAGSYWCGYTVSTGTTAGYVTSYLRMNGTDENAVDQNPSPVGVLWGLGKSVMLDFNGSTDYIELVVGHGAAGTVTTNTNHTTLWAICESVT